MGEGNGHIDVLRATGFDGAADLLERLDAINAKQAADEPDQPRADPPRQSVAADAEAARQAEGEAMMAALRASIPGIYDDR